MKLTDLPDDDVDVLNESPDMCGKVFGLTGVLECTGIGTQRALQASRNPAFRTERRVLMLEAWHRLKRLLRIGAAHSRRTMFRRFGKQAKNALSVAANPLSQEDRPVGISETIHEQVVSYFEDRQKIPDRPTPHR